jgi:hypothetical protein
VETLQPEALTFDPDLMRTTWAGLASRQQRYLWTLDPDVMGPFWNDGMADAPEPQPVARAVC